MWSHYADSHKGFCVEIDTDRFKEFLRTTAKKYNVYIDVLKVEYNRTYPLMNPIEIKKEEYLKSLFMYKSASWSYEKEYRYIFFDKSDCPLKIDKGIIKKVILGCEMPDKHKEEIIQTVKEQNTKISIYQAKKKKDEFGLDIVEINI